MQPPSRARSPNTRPPPSQGPSLHHEGPKHRTQAPSHARRCPVKQTTHGALIPNTQPPPSPGPSHRATPRPPPSPGPSLHHEGPKHRTQAPARARRCPVKQTTQGTLSRNAHWHPPPRLAIPASHPAKPPRPHHRLHPGPPYIARALNTAPKPLLVSEGAR